MNDRLNVPLKELLVLGAAGNKQDSQPGPVFEPFDWITPEAMASASWTRQAELRELCQARDVASGVAVLLEMLEREELDEGSEDSEGKAIPKLFDRAVRGNLQRLAVTSLHMLGETLDRRIARVNEDGQEREDS